MGGLQLSQPRLGLTECSVLFCEFVLVFVQNLVVLLNLHTELLIVLPQYFFELVDLLLQLFELGL
jgi:hypothetical protein